MGEPAAILEKNDHHGTAAALRASGMKHAMPVRGGSSQTWQQLTFLFVARLQKL